MGKKVGDHLLEAQQPQGGQPQGGRAPPAHEIRVGRLRAAIWTNESKEHGRWFSLTLSRTYVDAKTGAFRSANSLGRDDLLPAALILQEAFKWIASQNGGAVGVQPNGGSGDEEIPI